SHLPALQRPFRTASEVLRRMRQAHESGKSMRRLRAYSYWLTGTIATTAKVVGRTPWSARDALVPLPAQRYRHLARRQQADGGVGRGPGGPPHPVRALLLLACVPAF